MSKRPSSPRSDIPSAKRPQALGDNLTDRRAEIRRILEKDLPKIENRSLKIWRWQFKTALPDGTMGNETFSIFNFRLLNRLQRGASLILESPWARAEGLSVGLPA